MPRKITRFVAGKGSRTGMPAFEQAEHWDEEVRAKAPAPGSNPAHQTSIGAGLPRTALRKLRELKDRAIFRVEQTQQASRQ
jgi:hypothetical protein